MKLNYDLIREILFKIEEISDGCTNYESQSFVEECFPEYQNNVVFYHLKYLRQSNLIEPMDSAWIIDLTPQGHEYLNNIRTDTAWNQVKAKIQPLGSVALSVVAEVAKSLALSKLGL